MIEHLLKKDGYVYRIDLFSASDEELMEISRKMGLALNLYEMKKIRDYFKKQGRLPTDVEVQSLAHAWSEHCCYKSSKPLLRKYLYRIGKEKVIAREDAGVIEFDDEHYYVAALESHNHPSAIEPYGGAATGVGGIIRDVLCMGAEPLALIDPLFFGELDISSDSIPAGVKHPRYLFKRVVDGIRDYGNRVGIPTIAGNVYFHPGYTGNCLVNVGCIGIVRKDKMVRSRVKSAGEMLIYAGGKTGRDGIHGVTFASEELREESEEESITAVQLGDPITKEPLIHAVLECNEKGYIEGMKDMGGGGLSCVSTEMAHAGGLGAEIWLDKVPLRQEMEPWEIWISESQERMMLSVKPENVDRVLEIFSSWDVEAVVVGRVIKEPYIRVYYKGQLVEDVELDFQVAGVEYEREWKIIEKEEKEIEFDMPDIEKIFRKILSAPNVASREWIIRQYDHQVKGNTVVKSLHGMPSMETHGDAAIIKPLRDSFKGLAITSDINPYYTELSPYWGTASAIDEACRNLAAVGAIPDAFLDCLNFGNPEKPERMGEFYESVKALHDMASALNIPFISGNVSFYNEWHGRTIPPTPTITAIGKVNDVRKTATAYFKKEGNNIFLIGETKKEMGGSEYYRALNLNGGIVPRTDASMLKKYVERVVKAIEEGIIISAHDISNGGMAVAIAEMSFGGMGAEIWLDSIADLRSDIKLFSESNTRWVVEVEDEERFINLFRDLSVYKIGKTGGDKLIIKDGGREHINDGVNELKEIWREFIEKRMG
ncbi:MAG: phosphoribosylformylglycinamidine synthase subunit PurL [Thermoplasmata archaeon]|nr:phosphoribosylformylglycinamidine synthase subunit PurL [Thermoplasmata archaeon]